MTVLHSRNREILLISRCPPYPLTYGDRLIPYYLAKELSRRGYQIDLLAFFQEPEDRADVPYYERFFHSVTLIEEPLRPPFNLVGRALSAGRRFPTRRSQSWGPDMWSAIESRLQHHHLYDAVHLFGGVHVYEYRELARRYPTIIAPYESYSLYLERALDQAGSRLERLLCRAQLAMARNYESWMFRGFRRTVVVSEKDAAALKRLSRGLPVSVIPNGVDLDFFTPSGDEPETPTLIFTGNYAYRPNQDAAWVLIRQIFPLVKKAVPDAELLIVGINPPPDLQAVSVPGVRVTGRVPDLRPYFERAAVYVSPLRLGAGIKNKVLEAMAMQTAVVATPLSCDGIDVEHGRDVVLARRPEEMARSVIRLLQEPVLRQQIAVNGRKVVEERYTWRVVADAYEQLYAEVIEEHGGSV